MTIELIVYSAFGIFVGGGIIFLVFAPFFPHLKHRCSSHIVGNYEIWEDIRGRCHRTDGPALVYKLDDVTSIDGGMWYWHGKSMTMEQWFKAAGVGRKKKAMLLLKYKNG